MGCRGDDIQQGCCLLDAQDLATPKYDDQLKGAVDRIQWSLIGVSHKRILSIPVVLIATSLLDS